MKIICVLLCLATATLAQYAIWDLIQTTWDRSKLLTYTNSNPPIQFGSPGPAAAADISVNDASTFQSIWGFGGSLTDSSALLLNNLKNKNPSNYQKLLTYLFDPTDGANAAGLSYIRVPLGASDFSATRYSFDDVNGDTAFNQFDINRAPSYLFSVLSDIRNINKAMRIHIVPWSPPAWMKTSNTMNGGALKPELLDAYATYLLKCVQGFTSKGFRPFAITIQNEPQYSNPTYPTSVLTPAQEGGIGLKLRQLLDSNGFGGTKIIGYDHNWSSASSYPVKLMDAAESAFDGVSFHCYGGSVNQQDDFNAKYPQKQIYFTECSGTLGSDWWSDIKWYLDNIFIGSIAHRSHIGLMWNLALDGRGEPRIPGTSSCGGSGCRGIVTINSDGTYSVNQEFYAMAQVSKATIPRDVNGPPAQRIQVSVGGNLGWALRVGAFVTGRANSGDWSRISLVVLNWNDNSGGWNPQPVRATISFRGTQATYTFPVGVTTLWWYAPAASLNGTIVESEPEEYHQTPFNDDDVDIEVIDESDYNIYMDESDQTPLQFNPREKGSS